jgi:hypothetical protein
MSHVSSVGIATGYRLDDSGFGVPVPLGLRIFISPYRPYRLWGPPRFLLLVTGSSFSGLKGAGTFN